eukprot:jgi/Mesen1/6021/ME000306S05270
MSRERPVAAVQRTAMQQQIGLDETGPLSKEFGGSPTWQGGPVRSTSTGMAEPPLVYDDDKKDREAERAVHFVPIVILVCGVILWMFHTDVDTLPPHMERHLHKVKMQDVTAASTTSIQLPGEAAGQLLAGKPERRKLVSVGNKDKPPISLSSLHKFVGRVASGVVMLKDHLEAFTSSRSSEGAGAAAEVPAEGLASAGVGSREGGRSGDPKGSPGSRALLWKAGGQETGTGGGEGNGRKTARRQSRRESILSHKVDDRAYRLAAEHLAKQIAKARQLVPVDDSASAKAAAVAKQSYGYEDGVVMS